MFPLVLVVLTFLVCSSDGSDVVLGILGNSAFIECQLPISNTLIWQTENGNVIAMNGRVINENSTKYLIEKQNGLRESLVIHDLTLADDNIFRCFDLKNRTFVDSTKLNVLARPPMMNVTVTPPQPMLEGTEVTLTCEADGGKPLPEIRWFIKSTNGSVTEVNGNVTDIKYPNGTGHRTNTLRTTVTRDLYRATFICNVTVSLLYQETFTVDTDVLLAPLMPEITSRHYDGSFDENSVLKVQCSSEGGRPTPTIYWLLDGNRVGDVEVVVKTHENGTATVVSNLSKQMTRVYNGSVLTCAATNRVLRDQGLPPRVANITLLASYKPNVSIQQMEYTTKLGDNVTFICNIDANPLPHFEQLYWTNKGVMVDRKYYYLSNESDVFSLNLQDVEITDTGYYACHAVNRLGTSSSEQIKLTVLYAPVCEYSSVQKVAVRLGEGAGLNCSMTASPNDVMFTWRYRQNDERITKMRATKDMRSIDHVYGVLDLTVGSQIRYGEIECHGNNTQGISPNPCIFEIVPPGPPEIPGNCSTTVDKSQVQIKCVAGFNGGSSQHFILQKLGNIEFETLLANDIPDFQFNSYENVTIRICAYNDDYKNIRNCAIPSEIVVYVPDVPQSDPVKEEKSHKTAYIAGGVIAAFGVIIIAVIVSVLLFRRYKKGKTSGNINDLESVSANKEDKSNKFQKWWKSASLKQFTDYFRKSGPNQSTLGSVQQRETVTEIDDNDTHYQDFVRISSTPYHPFKAYRIDRKANCSEFNEHLEQIAKEDRKIAHDVLNESTGFALSPIVARNIDAKRSYQAESPVTYLDNVIETHSIEAHYNETTDIGLSNCYNTADMIDALCESDTRGVCRDNDDATANVCVKTLDKEYTDGDIADVLDSSEENILEYETYLQKKNETESDSATCEHNKTAEPANETRYFEDSVTILKFMNVDFSAVSVDEDNASKVNNVSEESLARSSENSFDKCILIRSPTTTSFTGISGDKPVQLAKSYSLPYRNRKQRQTNLNKGNSLSNLNVKNEFAAKSQSTNENLQKWNHSIKSYSSDRFSSDQTSYTTAIDIDNTTSDNSSRTTHASDTICDIDEFTLTVTSETTTDFGSKEEIDSILCDTLETPDHIPKMKNVHSTTCLDVDQFTLTITSESDIGSINVVDDTQDIDNNSTDVMNGFHGERSQDSPKGCDSERSTPRRDLLRRHSFMEAISNSMDDVSVDAPPSKKTSVVIDSETEGSYFNYGYEIESDNKYDDSEGKTTGQDNTDTNSVNVVAYF